MKPPVYRLSIVLILVILINTFVSGARAWLPEEFEDDFGTKSFVLSTYFDQDTRTQSPDGEPEGSRYAAIGLRCQDSDLAIAFRFTEDGESVKLWKKKTVDIKLDSGKSIAWPMAVGPSNYGWLGNEMSLVKQIKKSKTLYIRATDTTGSFITANFNIQRLNSYIAKFKKYGCKI